MFPTAFESIQDQIKQINPRLYGRTRNFKNGAVTRLSPYISRGVISTAMIFDHIKSLNLPWNHTEKLVQELAWRDYWQQVWVHKKDQIFSDIRHKQSPHPRLGVPSAILNATTGINAVDEAIEELYKTGYMHNHMRMYVASICCNIAQCHWYQPALWMYYHLYDGDLASNMLSWQWVAGTNSNKKYYANQDNINKYFNSTQHNTFLNVSYDDIPNLAIPDVLEDTEPFQKQTHLDQLTHTQIIDRKTTCIYNYYNIDPTWRAQDDVQRVLQLEPELMNAFSISDSCLDFAFDLSKNIPDLKIFIGPFSELKKELAGQTVYYKEHPTSSHYEGAQEPRDWMFNVTGDFKSFFSFWKKCKKQIGRK